MATDPTAAAPRIRVGPARRVAFHLLGALFALLRPLLRRRVRPDRARSVLVVEPYGMGDIIALEPALTTLLHAGWDCSVLTRAAWLPLLPPGVRPISPVLKPWNQTSLAQLLALAWRLRRNLRDDVPAVGIDPRGDIRTLLVLAIVGCPRCVTFDHYVGFDCPLRLPWLETRPDAFDRLPKWRLNLSLTEPLLGAPAVARPPVFPAPAPASAPAHPLRVGIVPLAPWEGKLWPPENWAELLRGLRAAGREPLLLCGPGETARARQAVNDPHAPCLENPDVPAYAAALRACPVVVTLDTGPMHLAGAVGCAVVALFGTGQLPLWAPAADPHRTLTAPALSANPPPHPIAANAALGRAAMAEIPPSAVLAAVQSLPLPAP